MCHLRELKKKKKKKQKKKKVPVVVENDITLKDKVL